MNVQALKITFDSNGRQMTIYPALLKGDDQLLLVDCGYAGLMPLLEEAVNKAGYPLAILTGVIITHHDMDHVGGLHELKTRYPELKVYASAMDAPYISGARRSLRLQQAEALYDSLPADQKEWARQFQEMLGSVQPVKVDRTFSEEHQPAFIKGIQVIDTPGHMPGHISIYVPDEKTLIAGDALVYENGALGIANPDFTMDMEKALLSVKKLQSLPIDKIICYHGGVVDQRIQEGLRSLVGSGETGPG